MCPCNLWKNHVSCTFSRCITCVQGSTCLPFWGRTRGSSVVVPLISSRRQKEAPGDTLRPPAHLGNPTSQVSSPPCLLSTQKSSPRHLTIVNTGFVPDKPKLLPTLRNKIATNHSTPNQLVSVAWDNLHRHGCNSRHGCWPFSWTEFECGSPRLRSASAVATFTRRSSPLGWGGPKANWLSWETRHSR